MKNKNGKFLPIFIFVIMFAAIILALIMPVGAPEIIPVQAIHNSQLSKKATLKKIFDNINNNANNVAEEFDDSISDSDSDSDDDPRPIVASISGDILGCAAGCNGSGCCNYQFDSNFKICFSLDDQKICKKSDKDNPSHFYFPIHEYGTWTFAGLPDDEESGVFSLYTETNTFVINEATPHHKMFLKIRFKDDEKYRYKVLDEDQQPIPGVEACQYITNNDGLTFRKECIISDENGFIEATVYYDLHLSKEGYIPARFDLLQTNCLINNVLILTMKKSDEDPIFTTISGWVVDGNNHPLQNIPIKCSSDDDSWTAAYTQSDKTGYWECENLQKISKAKNGKTQFRLITFSIPYISVEAKFNGYTQVIYVPQDSHDVIIVSTQNFITYHGQVINKETREPIMNANVQIGDIITNTNINGEFTIDTLKNNIITISAKNYLSSQIDSSIEEEENANLLFELEPCDSFKGQLIDKITGEPLRQYIVNWSPKTRDYHYFAEGYTDKNGNFVLDEVFLDDYGDFSFKSIDDLMGIPIMIQNIRLRDFDTDEKRIFEIGKRY